MEPPSPIQAFGVNPFLSRLKKERFPEEVSRADIVKSRRKQRNDSSIVLRQASNGGQQGRGL